MELLGLGTVTVVTTTGESMSSRVLLGKRVLITGASKGIGAALALTLAEAGASLVISGRDRAALAQLADRLEHEHGTTVATVVADLADPDAPIRLAEEALAALGGLEALINNAGLSHPELVVDLTPAKLDETLQVNLRAPMLLAGAVGKAMADAGHGSIISIASTAGLRPLAEHYAYCVSKAGLLMATKMLALELGPFGVRANAICPTVTLTDMGQRVWLDQPDKAGHMLQRIPLGRFVQPREVGDAAVWLASDASAMINGVELPVDGGYLIS
jgi:NAD(P)-dependent dehydrogenase (short-subunit alcohol dehydrogenase family)